MANLIVEFVNSEEQSIDLDTESVSIQEAESTLINLGFEYGEEVESDGVRYSLFHSNATDITLKKPYNKTKYELIKE